jgi:hypothetical protein
MADPAKDPRDIERDKIRGAIRTDFILSAEIIAITLGTVAAADFVQQVIVLATVAIAMTIGVYGLVAAIVKLDDFGLHLTRRPGALSRRIGAAIVSSAPMLMKTLAVVGTAAMFMVGGGILVHGIPPLAHAIEGFAGPVALALSVGVGIVAGAVVLGGVKLVQRVMHRS